MTQIVKKSELVPVRLAQKRIAMLLANHDFLFDDIEYVFQYINFDSVFAFQ